METAYMNRLLKRLNERKSLHSKLASQIKLKQRIGQSIRELEADIVSIDNKISILTPIKDDKKESS